MTIDEAFYSKVAATAGLTAIIGTRCYPKFVPQTGRFPCIQFDSDLQERGKSSLGTNSLNQATIHAMCWETTEAKAQTLGAALVTTFKNISKATWGTVKIAKSDVANDGGSPDQIVGNDGLLKFGRAYEISVWYIEQ